MRVLSLSDEVVELLYHPGVQKRYGDIDLVLGCGDMPYYYLEYLVSALNVPVYYVRGNHSSVEEHSESGIRKEPGGALDLHRRSLRCGKVILAGIEGCIRYNPGNFQYSQQEMWLHVFRLIPSLLLNKLRWGRFLDIFISHAPPWGVHGQTDLPHQGVKAFRWLDITFKPRYHFHGHIHLYRLDAERETFLDNTRVVNTYRYRVTDL